MTVIQTVSTSSRHVGFPHRGGGSGETALTTDVHFEVLVKESSISATWQRNERVLMFLENLYHFCEVGREQQALRSILAKLESQLRDGDAAGADAVLKLVDVARLAPSVLLAALSITSHGRESLGERTPFLERAESELIKQLGETRTRKLLASRR